MSIRDQSGRGGAANNADAKADASADPLHDLYALPVGTLPTRGARRASPCPVCHGTLVTDRFTVATEEARADGLYSLIECSACGHGRLDPTPTPDAIRAFYPDHYYGRPGTKFRPAIEGLVRFVGRRHVRFLTRGLAPGAKVLDVGCGRGVLLGPLADEGLQAHGFELSEEAARGADARAEIRIGEDLRSAGYAEASFDLVVIWHVLEHLTEPRATLEEIRRVLRPGGRLVVAVPNYASWQARWSGAAWFHLDLPRHLHHFTAAGLERLIKEVGFRPRSAHHFSLRQNPFGWIQSALNRLESLPRNQLYAVLHNRADASATDAPAATPSRSARLLQLTLFALLAPISLFLTIFATAARQGGTVHFVAERVDAESNQDAPLKR
ncbi:MAG: class I SAM-dependent methyltransferase [Myxococcota bacterium]